MIKESSYWAAKAPKELAEEMLHKRDEYWTFLENSGIMGELKRSYSMFYGNSAIDELQDGKTAMTVNQYGSLVRSLHTLVCQNRPAAEARAMNSDYDSQSTVLLANGLLDYYMKEKRLEDLLKNAALLSLFLREGWVTAEWNTKLGEPVAIDPESGEPINNGDIEFNVYSILDIIRAPKGKTQWHIIRKETNKYDLAAQYPELADEILSCGLKITDRRKWSLSYIADTEKEADSDLVETLTLYHAKSPALPEGRVVTIVEDTVLLDSPLPYQKPYIFSISAMDSFQTNFGHSPAMDLMPMQDALDTAFSIALSNINSFGVGSLISEKGTLQINQIKEGLLHLEHSKGSAPPQMLNLLQIPNEIFNFAETMIRNQETISAVNAVARGNPPSQMSGTAMALVAQQALVFSSSLQQSYNTLIENVGTALIQLLQTFAHEPRVAQIAGKVKKSMLKEFKADDLLGISRFVVDSANAFTKTTAGKVEVANQLLQTGLIKTPEQYLQVVNTGNLEPLVEHDTAQLMLIRAENEALTNGQAVTLLATDDDRLHVLEHSCVLNNPEVRQNPTVMEAALSHIQEHINQSQTKNPMLAQMLNQTPPAPPALPSPGQAAPPMDLQNAPVPEPAEPPPGAPQMPM